MEKEISTFDPNFGKTGFALRVFNLRFRRLRINQHKFADRFGIPFGTLKDVEQGRTQGSSALRVLIELIDHDPGAAETAAQAARMKRLEG